MHYVTKGTCSRAIDFDVVDGKVTNTKFTMGCMGNTQGVASLVEGMEVEEVIKRLKGIDCGGLLFQRNIMPRSVGKST